MKSVAESKAEVDAARARLEGTIGELRERTTPGALLGSARETAKKRATQAAISALSNAKVRPVAAAGVAAASIAYLFRNPIIRALRKRLAKGDE